MSTPKTSQPGDTAAKHLSFTPAHHEAGDNARSQQSKTPQDTTNPTSQQRDNLSAPKQEGSKEGLEAKAKSWINQQQWLQNVDVNQLSKQAKDLGTKAVEQVNRLTPTQKVVGGALLVSGLSWLALRSKVNQGAKSQISDNADHDDTWQPSSESVYRGRQSHS